MRLDNKALHKWLMNSSKFPGNSEEVYLCPNVLPSSKTADDQNEALQTRWLKAHNDPVKARSTRMQILNEAVGLLCLSESKGSPAGDGSLQVITFPTAATFRRGATDCFVGNLGGSLCHTQPVAHSQSCIMQEMVVFLPSSCLNKSEWVGRVLLKPDEFDTNGYVHGIDKFSNDETILGMAPVMLPVASLEGMTGAIGKSGKKLLKSLPPTSTVSFWARSIGFQMKHYEGFGLDCPPQTSKEHEHNGNISLLDVGKELAGKKVAAFVRREQIDASARYLEANNCVKAAYLKYLVSNSEVFSMLWMRARDLEKCVWPEPDDFLLQLEVDKANEPNDMQDGESAEDEEDDAEHDGIEVLAQDDHHHVPVVSNKRLKSG